MVTITHNGVTFKEGDKVEQIDDCSGAKKGIIYTLKATNNRELQTSDNDNQYCTCPHRWKLIESTPKFKIGDNVKCINNPNSQNRHGAGYKENHIYTITNIKDDIYFGGINTNGVFEENLILLTDEINLTNQESPTNDSLTKKLMSVITNVFKSKENKALEHFKLGTTEELNETGNTEFVKFIFETGKTDKKEFFTKLVEAYDETKKDCCK